MNSKLLLGTLAATVFLSGGVMAKTAAKPKITLEQAQTVALKRINGTIEQADAVTERGKERYSIFVQQPNGVTTHEIISAKKGKILRLAVETPATAKIK